MADFLSRGFLKTTHVGVSLLSSGPLKSCTKQEVGEKNKASS